MGGRSCFITSGDFGDTLVYSSQVMSKHYIKYTVYTVYSVKHGYTIYSVNSLYSV